MSKPKGLGLKLEAHRHRFHTILYVIMTHTQKFISPTIRGTGGGALELSEESHPRPHVLSHVINVTDAAVNKYVNSF